MSENTRITLSAGQLSSMDDSTLCNAFHSDVWSRLSDESKLNLCQEVENRQAAADGVAPRTISAEPLQGSFYGYQQGDRIVINSNMLYDGVFRADVVDEQGNLLYTTEKPVEAVGWNTLDTVIHEHTHGVREDMGLSSYVYFDSRTDGNLYRIQGEEQAAYAAGQQFALTALQNAEQALGYDSERSGYIEAVKADSYQTALEQAKLNFNDPFIDKTLQQFISDYENGIVNENPSPSYAHISALYNAQLYQHFQQLQAEAQAMQNAANNSVAQAQQTATQTAENNSGQTHSVNQILTMPANNTNTAEPENSTNNTTTVSTNSLDNDDGGSHSSQKSSGSGVVNDDGGNIASLTSSIASTGNGITNDDGGSLSSQTSSGSSISNDDGGTLTSLSSSDNGITNDDGGSLSFGGASSADHGTMDDGGSSMGSSDDGADNSSSEGNDNGSDNSMD